MVPSGLITVESEFGVAETIDRLADAVTSSRMRVFARIDHRAGAVEAGLDLRPTELLIFGNPAVGTPLMQDRQSAGIDLPLKALAWQDANGQVLLAYDDPEWIAERHGLAPASAPSVEAMRAALVRLARAACTG